MTGAVFMRVTFAAKPADEAFITDLVDRVVLTDRWSCAGNGRGAVAD